MDTIFERGMVLVIVFISAGVFSLAALGVIR
jgi:hypothetical protein